MGTANINIRQVRMQLGWSAAEMARHLGCACDLILHWEKELAVPPTEVRQQLHHLQVSASVSATRIAMFPRAEMIMTQQQLAQITHDVVLTHFDN